MTTDTFFTTAARAEAERRNPPIDRYPDDFTYPRLVLREHKRGEFEAAAEWARDHLAADIREAQAEAWEEAYETGVHDAHTSMDFDGGMTPPARVNPHRPYPWKIGETDD